MTLNELWQGISSLSINLKSILSAAGYHEGEMPAVQHNANDPDQLFKLDEMQDILTKFSDVCHAVDYLKRPIKTEGTLRMQPNGRYAVNGIELTSGKNLEYLVDDGWHSKIEEDGSIKFLPYWCAGCIEHNGRDYYITGADIDLDMDGLKVRLR